MRSLLALSVTVVILSLMGCKTTQPTRPLENYTNDNRFENQSSTIRIPVRLNIQELENSLNQQLGEALYQDDSFNDGDKMKVTAARMVTSRLRQKGVLSATKSLLTSGYNTIWVWARSRPPGA